MLSLSKHDQRRSRRILWRSELIAFAVLAIAVSVTMPAYAQTAGDTCAGIGIGTGLPDSRIAACTEVIGAQQTTASDRAVAYYNRGSAYYTKGRYDLAIADCSQALRLQPNYAYASYVRGLAYNNTAQYDLAIADCSQALRLNPYYADAYVVRGLAYFNKRQYDLAIADYSQALPSIQTTPSPITTAESSTTTRVSTIWR